MYGEEISRISTKLARQFGVLDNFYDSGDVSGDGHVWSTIGFDSDYVEKTWPPGIAAANTRTHSEASCLGGISAAMIFPMPVNRPAAISGRILLARSFLPALWRIHCLRWCNAEQKGKSAATGPPKVEGVTCARR